MCMYLNININLITAHNYSVPCHSLFHFAVCGTNGVAFFVQLKIVGDGGDPDGHDDEEDEHH
jgi:hypothetical protein